MSPDPARYRRRRRKTRLSRQIAVCVGLRHPAQVARRQLRTADYPEEARIRLGKAVEAARIAAGYPWRPAFAKDTGVSKRSLVDLEQGKEGIGQKTLFAVAQVFETWTEETPRIILEGGPVPPPTPVVEQHPEPPGRTREMADLSHLSRERQREVARQVMDMLPLARELGDDVYELWRERAMEFVARYGGPDADENDMPGEKGQHVS